MKKIFCVIVILLTFFCIKDIVYATVNDTNTEIECIYGNGVVAGFSYNPDTKAHSAYIKEYPVAITSEIDGDKITNISFYNNSMAVKALTGLTCPSEIRYWKAWEYADKSQETKTFRGVYAFSWCTDSVFNSGCKDGSPTITNALNTTKTSGWFLWAETEQTGGTINVTGTNLAAQAKPEAAIPLVAERLYFVRDLGTENSTYGHTYKLENKNEQAISSGKYAQIYKGSTTSKRYLQIGDTVTTINSSLATADALCIRESTKISDSSRGDATYKFSRVRHEVKKADYNPAEKKYFCQSGSELLYVRTTDVCRPNVGETAGSFCDKYPNTAFVIVDIIIIAQILVPAIVIIFTGIEFGRIVLAGNIEEELPKRKKSIIIRFIIMFAFFFLPIITRLIVSLVEGVSILDVSCLFNNGQRADVESLDSNCVPADE